MGSSDQTTTQVSKPFKPSIPLLETGATEAQNLFQQGNLAPAVFGGSLVTPFSTQTQDALTQIENIARQGGGVAPGAQNFANTLFQNQGLTPQQQAALGVLQSTATGPGLAGSADFNALLDAQTQRALEQVQSQFSGAGRLGSGANLAVAGERIGDIRLGQTVAQQNRDLNTQLAAAQGVLQGGAQGTNAALQAAGLVPLLDASRFSNAAALGGVGAQREALAQRQLLDQQRIFQGTEDRDLLNLQNLVNFGIGIGGTGGTVKTTQPGPSTGQLIGGGLLGGLSLLSPGGLFGGQGAFGSSGLFGSGFLGA